METCPDAAREPHPPSRGFPYWRVMIAVSGSWLPAKLIDYATASLDTESMFHIVAAVAPQDGKDPDALSRARCQTSNMIKAACNLLISRGRQTSGELLTLPQDHARRVPLLADAAARWGTDLLLTSWSSPVHLAHAAHCPVLALPDASGSYNVPAGRIFVASDDSDASRAALDEVGRIVQPGDDVRVVRVALDAHLAPPADSVDAVVLNEAGHGGNLARAIVGAALEWRADLLVLGTHAGEPSDKWRFASIAGQVAQLGVLPLLLVPFAARRR
jgi:hypothetical protein